MSDVDLFRRRRGSYVGVPGYVGAAPSIVAALWTPDQLGAALVAWWDPGQGVTLNGSTVSSWVDRVGGIAATQATPAAQPTFSATARNGKPGLTFAGAQRLAFDATPLPTGTSASVLAVAAYNTTASAYRFAVEYGQHATNKCRAVVVTNTGKTSQAVFGAGDNINTTTWNGDQFVVGSYLTTSLEMYIDGTLSSSKTGSTYSTAGTAGAIGSDINTSVGEFWSGTIQHVLMCNRALTTAERQKLEGWESWADGKAGANLPAGHPFKARAPTTAD